MTNQNNHEGCRCCGSYLSATHAYGCPADPLSKHVTWAYADGRSMADRNKQALMELAELVREKVAPA
jgi:hypothetical protein